VPIEPSERSARHRRARQLTAVITENRPWYPTLDHQALEFVHDLHAADRGIDHHARVAFAAEIV
jgi:hypothetical protein